MKEVLFKDGRKIIVDADILMIPRGEVVLTKQGKGVVASYAVELVNDVRDVKVHPIKELAIKLFQACSKSTPHGSRKLAQMAGIEYDDRIIPILKKLREAGKIVFADGKWVRA